MWPHLKLEKMVTIVLALLLLQKNFCESFLMAILRHIFSFPEVKLTKSEHCQNPKPAKHCSTLRNGFVSISNFCY